MRLRDFIYLSNARPGSSVRFINDTEQRHTSMRIDVRIDSKGSSGPLRAFAQRLLIRKLSAYARSIQHAHVRLSDINGPRGGKDKECQIRLSMGRKGAVVVTRDAFDWYDAVLAAVSSARVGVDRRLDRLRERRKSARRNDQSANRLAAAKIAQLEPGTGVE